MKEAPKGIFKDRTLMAVAGGAALLTAAGLYVASKTQPPIEEWLYMVKNSHQNQTVS